jgi:plasmid stability protein
MTTITIRNVDPAVRERLRERAARHGRSMEAEVRMILSEAVAAELDEPEPKLAQAIRRRFAPLGHHRPDRQAVPQIDDFVSMLVDHAARKRAGAVRRHDHAIIDLD